MNCCYNVYIYILDVRLIKTKQKKRRFVFPFIGFIELLQYNKFRNLNSGIAGFDMNIKEFERDARQGCHTVIQHL